jgi:hypothetical protein
MVAYFKKENRGASSMSQHETQRSETDFEFSQIQKTFKHGTEPSKKSEEGKVHEG